MCTASTAIRVRRKARQDKRYSKLKRRTRIFKGYKQSKKGRKK